ncbi:HAMP domain-containing protein [bacterium]|nr:HAMP domain-containing protein [bacterium]
MSPTTREKTRARLNFLRRAYHNLSLGRKLLFTGATAVLMVAGALTATTYVSAEDSLRSQMHRQAHNELKVFERLYEIRLDGGPPRLDPQVALRASTEMVDLMGGFSAVFAGDRPIAVAGLDGQRDDAALRLLAGLRADQTEGYTLATIHGTSYVVAIHPLSDADGQLLGAFVRGIPLKQISDMLQKHAWGIFSISGTAMLLALVALTWLTREITAPMRRLTLASRTLAEHGEAAANLPEARRSDEFGRLATDFKAIADRLAAQKTALEEKDRLRGQLLEKLISAQEDERRRISRELHDQTGQSLTSLLVGLKVLRKAHSPESIQEGIEGLQALLHETLDEVHRLSVELRPAMLDDLGLVAAVRAQAKDFEAAHGVRSEVAVQGLDHRLPAVVETSVYRIVQEALTNVAKYARARHVVIRLAQTDGQFTACVSDDGVGFDPAAALHSKGRESLGLVGMQERVGLLGGTFAIDSAPGRGTNVHFGIPLDLGDPTHG